MLHETGFPALMQNFRLPWCNYWISGTTQVKEKDVVGYFFPCSSLLPYLSTFNRKEIHLAVGVVLNRFLVSKSSLESGTIVTLS